MLFRSQLIVGVNSRLRNGTKQFLPDSCLRLSLQIPVITCPIFPLHPLIIALIMLFFLSFLYLKQHRKRCKPTFPVFFQIWLSVFHCPLRQLDPIILHCFRKFCSIGICHLCERGTKRSCLHAHQIQRFLNRDRVHFGEQRLNERLCL